MTRANEPTADRVSRAPKVRALVASLAALLVWSTASPVLATGILPASNPRSNIAPSPNFLQSGQCSPGSAGWSCQNPCVTTTLQFPIFTNQPECTSFLMQSLTNARRTEGLDALVLPTNWAGLTPPEQLFVLADLERTTRGLPPYLGLNDKLSDEAQRAARWDTDPHLAAGFSAGTDPQGYLGMGGAWSTGFSTLTADYFWMYDDGWGGSAAATSNQGCTSATAAACWAHRDQLLGYDPKFNPGVGLYCRTCEMGTGYAVTWGFSSFVDLVELPAGTPPAMTFTWAKDVVPFLPKPDVPAPHKQQSKPSHHARPHRGVTSSTWRAWIPQGLAHVLCVTLGSKHWFGAPSCRTHRHGRSAK